MRARAQNRPQRGNDHLSSPSACCEIFFPQPHQGFMFVFYKRPHCACCRAFPRARSAVPPQRSLAQLSTARPTPPHWDTPVCRTAGPPRAAARRGRAGADRRSSQTLLCFGPRRGWVLWQLRQCVVTACLPHLGRDHASRWGWHQKYPYSPQKQTGFSFLLLI